MTLTWTAPGNGGSPITGYRIYRGGSSGAETLLTPVGLVTTYTDTTAVNGQQPTFDPDILMTSAASWNEDQPFPTADRTPQFERPKPNDPNKGTLEEKRRGPILFLIAMFLPPLYVLAWRLGVK